MNQSGSLVRYIQGTTKKIVEDLRHLEESVEQLKATTVHQKVSYQHQTCFVQERLYLEIRSRFADINREVVQLESAIQIDFTAQNRIKSNRNASLQEEIDRLDKETNQLLKGPNQTHNFWSTLKNHQKNLDLSNRELEKIRSRTTSFINKNRANMSHWKKQILEKYENEKQNLQEAENVNNLRENHKMDVQDRINHLQQHNTLPQVLPKIKSTITKESIDHDERMDTLLKELNTLLAIQDQYEEEVLSIQKQLEKSKWIQNNLEYKANNLRTKINNHITTQNQLRRQYNNFKQDLNH